MPSSTPLARTKTAALARVLDAVPRGYSRYVAGRVSVLKAERVIRKLHERHSIGATPSQRLTRKGGKKANAILAVFWPPEAENIEWSMFFTQGDLDSPEKLCDVADKPRLEWLGYELVQQPNRGAASWTWRRTKTEMSDLYALLADQCNRRHWSAVSETLIRIAHQPGFHGIRKQSWDLCQFARKNGYTGDVPYLYFVQKVSHGERMNLQFS